MSSIFEKEAWWDNIPDCLLTLDMNIGPQAHDYQTFVNVHRSPRHFCRRWTVQKAGSNLRKKSVSVRQVDVKVVPQTSLHNFVVWVWTLKSSGAEIHAEARGQHLHHQHLHRHHDPALPLHQVTNHSIIWQTIGIKPVFLSPFPCFLPKWANATQSGNVSSFVMTSRQCLIFLQHYIITHDHPP